MTRARMYRDAMRSLDDAVEALDSITPESIQLGEVGQTNLERKLEDLARLFGGAVTVARAAMALARDAIVERLHRIEDR